MITKDIRIALAVAALVVVVAGVAIYVFFLAGARVSAPPEHSARYYPDDVLAYAWFTLNPSMGQRAQMSDIWERFKEMRGFDDWVEGLEEDFDDETGFDFEDDVLPWLGAEVSGALFDIGYLKEDLHGAVTLDVRDSDGAADFLEDRLSDMEEGRAVSFEPSSYGDFDVWADPSGDQLYALSDSLMVFATTKEILEDVLDRVAGKGGRSLASDANFREARAALPDRRFMSAYMDYRQITDVLDAGPLDIGLLPIEPFGFFWFGMTFPMTFMGMGPTEDPCNGKLLATPDWTAMSAAWVDRGLVVDVVSPVVGDMWPDAPDVADPAEMLPEGTLGFLSMSFDPDLDHWREALRECEMADMVPDWEGMSEEINEAVPGLIESTILPGPPSAADAPKLAGDSTMADALDLGLWIVDQLVGINLEEDLYDYLGGDLFMAVHDVDFAGVLSSEPTGNLVDGVSILSYRPEGEERLVETVNDLVDRLEILIGQKGRLVDVGAENGAYVFDWDGQPLQPGYVFHEDYLTIGTTEKSLRSTVAQQQGSDDRLSGSEEYQRTAGYVPDGRQLLMYVNLQRILDEMGDDLLGDDLYGVWSDGLSAVAMSSGIGDDYSRATFVLSLLPER